VADHTAVWLAIANSNTVMQVHVVFFAGILQGVCFAVAVTAKTGTGAEKTRWHIYLTGSMAFKNFQLVTKRKIHAQVFGYIVRN